MSNLSRRTLNVSNSGSKFVKRNSTLLKNIEVFKAISEVIKTTLGPKGLNKMLVDTLGDVTVTGDGAKILQEIQVEHPAGKILVNLSKTISKKNGDGVSSAIIFAGELMAKTEELLSMNISPSLISDGYYHAIKHCKKILNKYAETVTLSSDQDSIFYNAVLTALNSKSIEKAKSLFAYIITKATLDIAEKRGEKMFLDLDNIQIVKKEGESLIETQLIEGIIIDKEIVNSQMPKIIKEAKIALIDGSLEIIKTDFGSEIQISNPSEISSFLQKEENILNEMTDEIIKTGANVVICQKGIDDIVQGFLNKQGILAVRRVKHSDMKKLAQATGAKIVSKIKDIKFSELGFATSVCEKKIGKDRMIFVEHCQNPKAVSVLIRGGTELIVDDAERSLKNGLAVAKAIIENPRIVGGAGSIEIQLCKELNNYAHKLGGKEQIAIEQYAEALEIIPKTLVENSGKNPLDLVTTLRALVDFENNKMMGFNSYKGEIIDVKSAGIFDSYSIKCNILELTTELIRSFVKIDDYIKVQKKK
ncbi:MAG: thermosome subunit beta [Promethearchaeota archaeon]